MTIFDLSYYQNDDRYSDGDIENTMLSYVKREITWEEVKRRGDLYPVLYHLSDLRENILSWYPFEEDAAVLEVGAGCGALTGLLCRKTGRVVSVELSKRRAMINYERHKEFDNLQIMVGNLNDMTFARPFDYVVLNGVLEYAISFTEGSRPYERFINSMKRFLKPGGRLLVAIENRLGLKYFNGAPEDHTGHYFEGVNGYVNNDTVRTFSQPELSELLSACGLSCQKFYYPYPDYKFPTEIFTDETILNYKYGKDYINLDEKWCRLFDERGLWQTLSKEAVTASFANSFLVDASAQPAVSEDQEKNEKRAEVLYVKLNNDRHEQFRISTSILRNSNQMAVSKAPLTEQAKNHIKTLQKNITLMPDGIPFQNLAGEIKKETIVYQFLTGMSLDQEIGKLIQDSRINDIVELLHQVFDAYGQAALPKMNFQTEEFQKVFGSKKLERKLDCICPANIDMICDNLFRAGDGWQVIDCEWVLDIPVPLTFIIWRAINELYTNHQELPGLFAKEKMLEEFGIDGNMGEVFWHWSTYFAKEYVGSDQMELYRKPVKGVSVEELIVQKRQEGRLCSSLYYDLGSGFSEDQKLYSSVELKPDTEEAEKTDAVEAARAGAAFCVTYDLRHLQGVRQLRWDPLEGTACLCRIRRTTGVKAVAGNAFEETDAGQLFLTTDPIYMLQTECSDGTVPETVTIEGTIRLLDAQELMNYLKERLTQDAQQSEKMMEQFAEMTAQQAEKAAQEGEKLKSAYEQAVKELQEIHSSRSWKLMNKISRFRKKK